MGPDQASEHAGAEATVERADLGAGLPEAGVLGGDREIADDVQDVAAADRIARDHRHHGLGHPADLDVEVGDVKPADLRVAGHGGRRIRTGDVAASLAADPLVAARAEGVRTLAGEDDDADGLVLAGALERIDQLDHRLGTEGVTDLGTVDGDLGDAGVIAGRELVADVREVSLGLPGDGQNGSSC